MSLHPTDQRHRDVAELEHEIDQLAPGEIQVKVSMSLSGARLLLELARAEWDRRMAEIQAHRIKVGQAK